jgi:Flp pilus assembly protein TadG
MRHMFAAWLKRTLNDFSYDRRGNVAILFAFALIPVFGSMGAAVDYSRASNARTELQKAADAAALAIAAEAYKLSPEQLSQKVQDLFNANFNNPFSSPPVVTASFTKDGSDFRVKVSATANVQLTVARVFGIDETKISIDSEVVWGVKRLEMALVLDVTGSMAAQGRMVELKKATKSLLDTLQEAAAASGKPDAVKISIVPFAAHVNVGNANTGWLDWTEWESAPAIMASWISSNASTWERTGPGTSCPLTNSTHGFRCADGPASVSNDSAVSTIPSSGSNAGRICPTRDNGSKSPVMIGRYYTGCYNSVEKPSSQWHTVATGSNASCGSTPNCSCSGNGSSRVCKQKTYTHTWVPNAKSTWDGCVRDRNKNHDVTDIAPTSTATRFQPFQNFYCPTQLLPLTSNWSSMRSTVDELTPLGATNIAIGLAWGWHVLSSTEPFTQGTPDPKPVDMDKVIILMTDGDNTLNRWEGNGSSNCADCDTRTALTCSNVKNAGITLYTIRLMEGNEALLRSCASDVSKYFNVTTASQLNQVFNAIAKSLANLRLSK